MNHLSPTFQRVLSFTKQLTSCINQGRHEKALDLFHEFQASFSLRLDEHVFSLVLKSCATINRPHLGTAIHSHIVKMCFLSNPFVSCALISMYGKCSSLSLARKLFDEIPQRSVVVWNSMISLYTHSHRVCDALHLFDTMDVLPDVSTFNTIVAGLLVEDDGTFKALAFYRRMEEFGLNPNFITLLALLPASLCVANLNMLKQIHGYSVRNGLSTHSQLSSNLVEAYGRCGCLVNACNVFKDLEDRDVVAWSSLISAYALQGEAMNALEAFQKMEMAKIRPDEITFLAVMKACSHAGLADEALGHFAKMKKEYEIQPSSDHYSCLIDVLSRAGRLHEAYQIIREMPMKPTPKAWGAILGACKNYGEVELAEIAGKALTEIEPNNPANYVLLARIYAGSGRYEEAQRLRRKMQENGVRASPGFSWMP